MIKQTQCDICEEEKVTLYNAIYNFTLLWENYLSPPIVLFPYKECIRSSFLSVKNLMEYQGHSPWPSPHTKPAGWKLCLWHCFTSLTLFKRQGFVCLFLDYDSHVSWGRRKKLFLTYLCYAFHLNSHLTSRRKNSIYFLYYPLAYSLLSLTTGICHVPFSYNLCYSEWNIICLCLWYLPFSLLGFLVRIICPILPYSMRPDEVKKSSNLNMTKI